MWPPRGPAPRSRRTRSAGEAPGEDLHRPGDLPLVQRRIAQPEGLRRRALQREARARQQGEPRLPCGFGPGLGRDARAAQPQREAPGRQIEGGAPGQLRRETLRQQIPPRAVDPARLAGMAAQIAVADQLGQRRLERRVALPVDGGAPRPCGSAAARAPAHSPAGYRARAASTASPHRSAAGLRARGRPAAAPGGPRNGIRGRNRPRSARARGALPVPEAATAVRRPW